jgi:asparagine synthase (glutamine-hydrolysing)
MNKTQALEQGEVVLRQVSSRWVGVFADTAPSDAAAFDCRLLAGEGRSRKLYLRNGIESDPPLCAERAGCGVILDGILYNRDDLRSELGEFSVSAASDDAELVLAAYQRWGEDFLKRLRGAFALIIWDSSREVLLCLRDPIGTYPMFYAETKDGLLVSSSMDALIRQPHFSAGVNRAALADFMLDRFPMMEETFFESVSRVPPGHVLRVTRQGRNSFRYWDPAPDGTVKWLTRDEVERFDELLDQAVHRCLSLGPAGILLSGGLDSVSVAAVAAQRATAEKLPRPLALSLLFPEPDVDEEIIQRSVATQLGLPQVLKSFDEAAGKRGLLAEAVALNNLLPAPILNTWWPAYDFLVREGERRGCRSILTGTGGDEWLGITPMLAADLFRELDFSGVYRLWASNFRSFRRPSLALLRAQVWTFGLGPLVIPPLHRVVKRVAPSAVRMRRRIVAPLPKWLAPDAALRKELEQRWEQRSLRETYADSSDSFYIREMKLGLEHPLVSWEVEEQFEFSRMAGVRVLHPLWDPDLVELLYRTPPFMLIHEGRTKGLVRASLGRRFPNLGFERQRKVEGTRFYSSLIYREAGKIWEQLGGVSTLASLGVVDERTVGPSFDHLLARRRHGDAHRAWSILNLESWARAHSQ